MSIKKTLKNRESRVFPSGETGAKKGLLIYHNPRCRKSREGLAVLEESEKKFEIIKYLDNPLTSSELEEIIQKLAIHPIELVRKTEKIWKENFKGKTLSDKEIINAMVRYPKLIERPIVVYKEQAVIGRPADTILEMIN